MDPLTDTTGPPTKAGRDANEIGGRRSAGKSGVEQKKQGGLGRHLRLL
jgi:hypothetical protein